MRRTVTGTAIASGVLLVLMGAGTVVVGLTTDGMPASSGRQADVSLWLQGVGSQVTGALGWVPGMGGGALLSCGRRAPGAALHQVVPEDHEPSWPDGRSDDDEPSEGAGHPAEAGQLAVSPKSGQASRIPGPNYA